MPDRETSGTAGGQFVAVDATLEDDISRVVRAVDAFLPRPNAAEQQSLLLALQHLDAQVDRSDAYHSSLQAHTGYDGMTSMYQVFGETGRHPLIDRVLGPTLRAQVDLVKAAKEVIRRPNPTALDALRRARAALESADEPTPTRKRN